MRKRLTPVKAIRLFCLEFCGLNGGSAKSVRECSQKRPEDCPLWPWRLGHDPARAGKAGNPNFRKRPIQIGHRSDLGPGVGKKHTARTAQVQAENQCELGREAI